MDQRLTSCPERAPRFRPTFSVIIATYNRAHLVGRAIRSVLAQTYRDFDILVVDDASTDETRIAVEAFGDPRVRYVRREENGGVAAATNDGIRQAKGEYVCFLGDDDEYMPEFLAETYRRFEVAPAEVGFMWCGIRIVQDTPAGEVSLGEQTWPRFESRNRSERLAFLFRKTPGTGYLTVRATCFDQVGLFDERLRTAVDLDLIIRLARHYDFQVIPQVLVTCHVHGDRRLSDLDAERAEAFERIIHKHIEFMRECPSLWTAIYSRAGKRYYAVGDKVRGREYTLKALQKAPLRWDLWKRFLSQAIFGTTSPNLRRRVSTLLPRPENSTDA